MKTKAKKGWSALNPEGQLHSFVENRSYAISEAAFAFTGKNCIDMPKDWRRAYRAGWRVVPVVLRKQPQ